MSPSRLKQSTVAVIASPGKITIHGAELTNTRFELIMDPQLGVGG
jgi:hypothetical protein